MKCIKIMGMLIVLFCGGLTICHGMESNTAVVRKKCVEKEGKTLWDLLMNVEVNFFDCLIDFLDERKPEDVVVVSYDNSGFSCQWADRTFISSLDLDDCFILDLETRDVIETLFFSVIQRNIPDFIALVVQAKRDNKIRCNIISTDCLREAISLHRREIIDIFVNNFIPSDECYHAVMDGLALAETMLSKSDSQNIAEYQPLVDFFNACKCSCSDSDSESQGYTSSNNDDQWR